MSEIVSGTIIRSSIANFRFMYPYPCAWSRKSKPNFRHFYPLQKLAQGSIFRATPRTQQLVILLTGNPSEQPSGSLESGRQKRWNIVGGLQLWESQSCTMYYEHNIPVYKDTHDIRLWLFSIRYTNK